MQNFVIVLVIVLSLGKCFTKECYENNDPDIIACHTSDFTCFKRQYLRLRDEVLLGNPRLGIPEYEPLHFEYGDACIKMSGLEKSQLVAVRMLSDSLEYAFVLELPLTLQEVANHTKCAVLGKDIKDIEAHNNTITGPLKEFTANATAQVVFPYDLKQKKNKMYMILAEEGLEVIVDVPDYSDYKNGTDLEQLEYELSEWAYGVVKTTEVAEVFVHPYISRMHLFTERIPMERFLLLYPEEQYSDLHFTYSDTLVNDMPSHYDFI